MKESHHEPHRMETEKARWLPSKLLLLFLFFMLAINGAFLVSSPLAKVDPDSLPAAHTWVWWATKEFQEQKRAPDVVLLGSSLVMHPVSRQDADYLNIDLDYVKHHRSAYLEQTLMQQLKLPGVLCFNFALPGGMVSDDYMVARALFTGEKKPKLMVLGLSVRDFIDNGVKCAGGTPAFRYLRRYTDTDDLLDLAMPHIWQRVDYLTGKYIYLWGKKLDIQVALAEQMKATLLPFTTRHLAASPLVEADPSRAMPSNQRSEVEEGMMIVKSHEPYSWEDNSVEYRKRYRTPNEGMFATQSQFLEKLLNLAKERNIEVLIVNMPLTKDNHSLMPSGTYERYLAYLQRTSKTFNCPMLDLDSAGTFDKSNFYDTSHMNASGGKKLLDAIVAKLSDESTIAARLGAPTLPGPPSIPGAAVEQMVAHPPVKSRSSLAERSSAL